MTRPQAAIPPLKRWAEPQVRYIDNVCGAVSDLGAGELQPAGSILRGETSGCLLQLPAERVAEAPRGRGPRTPQPPSPARIMDRVIELIARAVASRYLWDWGDGNDTLTYEPGRAWSRYSSGSIGHVYETRGRYDLSVEVVWEAQWRINGGAWQALGFFSLSDSVDYPVRQVQARFTRTTD